MNIVESTDIIARILVRAGVEQVVVSSGSRSLRMVRSVVSDANLNVRMIVDERVAAFFALGICSGTSRPVALICTSGTAMLNYAPAIAEAYYRGLPLIVISADRPRAMLDINDGQTIRQFHALDNIVKASIDIDAATPCCHEEFDLIVRTITEALSPRKGPVHINLHLEEGNVRFDYPALDYEIPQIRPRGFADESVVIPPKDFCDKKILIFIGQRNGDTDVDEQIGRLLRYGNIVVVADNISNCNASGVIHDTEPYTEKLAYNPGIYAPDILITLGKTSPISRRFKEWLRNLNDCRHWRVNDTSQPEDTYFHLERTIVADDHSFLLQLAEAMESSAAKCECGEQSRDTSTGNYQDCWQTVNSQSTELKGELLPKASWSDIYAVNEVLHHLPEEYDLHISNGMSIRYASFAGTRGHKVYANRGVNGIDGSTSTALGYAAASGKPVLLLTGDMSVLYDISALYSGQLSPRFKMIVMANGGGEIFRSINATRDYDMREEMLCQIPSVKWESVAQSVGMDYFEANDKEQLLSVLRHFFEIGSQAGLLVVHTPAGNSCEYRKIIQEIQYQL